MQREVRVNETLTVEVLTVPDLHLIIEREGGGLVRVELREVRGLVAALTEAGSRAAGLATGEPLADDDLPLF